jgi:hypothetical protein
MRRVIAVLAAFSLAVIGVITLSTAPSSASSEVTFGELPPGGTITLSTRWSWRSTGTVVYDDGEGGGTTQSLTQGCAPLSSPGVLSLNDAACFGTAGLGVGGGSRWYLNPDVSGEEFLSLSLDASSERLFASFSLDIEAIGLQSGPDIRVVPSLGGEALAPVEYDLNPLRVSGVSLPNYRLTDVLSTAADSLRLEAIGTTKFQLEGDTSPSTFDLVRYTDIVPCGETALSPEGVDATLTVTTGESCDGGEAVVFTRNGNEIDVLKQPSDATFLLEITSWLAEDAAYPVPATLIDYTPLDGVDNAVPMVVCAGTTAEPSLPAGFVDVIPGGDVDGWCVAGQSFELVGDGQMKVSETLYGQGDPRFNRI